MSIKSVGGNVEQTGTKVYTFNHGPERPRTCVQGTTEARETLGLRRITGCQGRRASRIHSSVREEYSTVQGR